MRGIGFVLCSVITSFPEKAFSSPTAPLAQVPIVCCVKKVWWISLRGGDGLAQAGAALPGVEVLTANDGLGLLDDLLALGEDELDVAGVGHVRVDLPVMLVSSLV